MSDFGLEYLVEYSQMFDDQLPELQVLLNGISRTRLLKVASFFLGFANRGSKFAHYRDFLQMFFSEENTKIGNDIYRRLSQVGKNPDAGIELINPQSILQLFEFCYNHLDENDTQTLAESEVNIFKAILVLNTQNNKTQEQGIDATKDEDEQVKLPALALAMSFPNSEFINSEITEILLGQFVRAVYLFEFLEQNDETKELLTAFLNHFNCATWKEYLKSIFPIAIAVVKTDREGIIDIVIEHNDDFEKSCDFIDKLILSENELLEEGYDFRAIRSKPLYKTAEGVYCVVYPLFVVELVFKGLYFKLREIHDGLTKDKRVKGGNFRSFYCDYFSEQDLLYKTLETIYGKRNYIQHSGSYIKTQHGVSAEPDYYIRNGNYTFLFESKDILINGSIKPTFDYEKYKEEFGKKLYFDLDKKGKQDKKAVLQLINNVERLLAKQLPNDTNYKPSSLHIYPILVLHDRQYNVSGLNALVNYWFNIELKNLAAKGVPVDKVKPITIIDIDTFILYQESFKSGDIKLNDIIDEYNKYMSLNPKKKYRTEAEAKDQVSKRLLPFSMFLSHYIYSKNLNKKAKVLFEKAIKLFE